MRAFCDSHLAWALELPPVDQPGHLPEKLRGSPVTSGSLSQRAVAKRREHAFDFWKERKRVTDPAWKAGVCSIPLSLGTACASWGSVAVSICETGPSREGGIGA